MKSICVVGTGYVGLVSGACFAELGNRVWCVDTEEAKVTSLNQGILPIYEPGLEEIVHRNMEAGRLSVTSSYSEGLKDADFVLVAVGTPSTPEGGIDLSYLRQAYRMIASNLDGNRPIIVNKSTVPPGTADAMETMISGLTNGTGPVFVVSNPEFLSEGRAVADFMRPLRVVIGAGDLLVGEAVAKLYRPLNCPILLTDTRSAEMIKYASNAFLAMKISFINEIAGICDSTGVDVDEVARGIGMDTRIGKDFLRAGIGYGGSCLPKDMAVLTALATDLGQVPNLLKATEKVNSIQPRRLVSRVKAALGTFDGTRIAVLGLTFKPGTDDLRHSSAIQIVNQLLAEGIEVKACDPQACRNVRSLPAGPEYMLDPYQAALGCDATILATEWPDYTDLDLNQLKATMRGNILADGRNAIDPDGATRAGFVYIGVGKGTRRPASSGTRTYAPMPLD